MFYVLCFSEDKSVLEDKPPQKNYDVVLMNDFQSQKDIPPKSVYISGGLAVEVKKFQKKVYVSFSKRNMESERKKYINFPIAEIGNVQKALGILEKHIKKYV